MDQHKNFAVSTIATAPSPATSGTSLVVASGDGAKFPTPPFNVVICPANTNPTSSNAEIVRVTAKSTDTFTITRSQESTSARTIGAGDAIFAAITAKTLTDIEIHFSSFIQTPKAPTSGVVDDTANTFDWTNNPYFTAAGDYEYTIDGGSSYSTCTAKPVVIGDISKAIGQVGVRVKATSDNFTSSTLYNTVAFVASFDEYENALAVFDFSDVSTITKNGSDQVTAVDDLLGGSYSLTTTGTSTAPIYHASGGSANNNKPYLTMSSGKFLNIPETISVAGAVSVFMIIRIPTFINNRYLLQLRSGSYEGIKTWQAPDASPSISNAGNGGYLSDPNKFTVNKFMILHSTVNGLRSSLGYDEELPKTAPFWNTGIGLDRFVINGEGGEDHTWEISEVRLYDGTLTSEAIIQIKSNLMSKYALVQSKPVLGFYGDSLTEGTAATGQYGFSQIWAAETTGYKAINEGIGGTYLSINTNNFGDRVWNILQTNKPKLVIMYGSNITDYTADPAAWKAFYKARIQEMLDAGYLTTNIYVCAPPYNSTRATTCSQVASDMGVEFIDFNAALLAAPGGESSTTGDGLHPNDSGHRIMADLLETIIPSI